MTDPIADMLIRIKNAQMAEHETVLVPFSKLKFEIAKILKRDGWISDFSKKGKKVKKFLEINLRYINGEPKVNDVKRISKPGRRVYIKASEIKSVRQGFGQALISTPQGILNEKEARAKKVGGEVLCEVW